MILIHHLFHWSSAQLHDWDHRATWAVGLAFAVAPPVEVLGRLLGLVALAVGIYCSVSRELRERRAEAAKRRRR